MTVIAGRRLLNEQLQAALALATARPFGLMQWDQTYVPTDTLPGSLLEPLPNPLFIAGWANNWREAEFPYAIHSYGIDMRSTDAMADLAQEVFITAGYVLAGFDIIEARPDNDRSKPEPVAPELFSVSETFILHVMAN